MQGSEAGVSASTAAFVGKGVWEGIPLLSRGSLLCSSFPLASTLLSHSTGLCGETRLAVLAFRGTEGFFCLSLQERTMKRVMAKANGGRGSCLHVGLCMTCKHMAAECNVSSVEISPGWNLGLQLRRNSYRGPLNKSAGGCVN